MSSYQADDEVKTMIVQKLSRRTFPVVLLLGFLAPSAAAAAAPCPGVDTSLSEDQKQEYAQLVASAVGNGVAPAQVNIIEYMQSGSWSAVHASTPQTDPGFLFFETAGGRPQFKEAWGGMASPSEAPQLIAWAKDLGAPDALARCFAQNVTG